MVIVQINYRRPDMPKAEWDARYSDETAKLFLSVAGLQWKIWLDGDDEKLSGGIYCFADRATAQAYVDGPIGRASRPTRPLPTSRSGPSTCAPARARSRTRRCRASRPGWPRSKKP